MSGKKRLINGAIKAATFPMTTYISLLRGVNVSGGNRIVKEDLKKAFENIGGQVDICKPIYCVGVLVS